jgi:cytochrome c oxidase subunit 2
MPVEVKVVSDAEFAAFVAQRHGVLKPAQAASPATAGTPVTPSGAPASPKPTPASASVPASGAPSSKPQ